ncbi:MAG: penicillin-binding protein 2 [Alphaproteobacteria bacterium]|nr:penicillin-binding protein 2 [Alphaproteobacteria bacterium]
MGSNKLNTTGFSRRVFVLGALQGSLLAVLGGRLAWLQLVQGDKYKTLSDKNRVSFKLVAPPRGEIFDRYGVPLALNEERFHILLDSSRSEDIEESLRRLARYIDLNEEKIQSIIKKSKGVSSFVPLEVKNDVSWSEVSKIEVNSANIPGIYIDNTSVRNYPLKEASAHLIGYVGSISASDLKKDPMFSLPGVRVGKTGIEKAYDKSLRGDVGNQRNEVNVRGQKIRTLEQNSPGRGDNLFLSIDAELQKVVQGYLERYKSASCVIMDAHTGAVYSLASHPGFDPNIFTSSLDKKQWQELVSNPKFPLNNKAISGQYPPGSTFKMVTALAALEAGVIHAGTTVSCSGQYQYGKDKFHCWKRSGHGTVNVVKSLMVSCDTYFYKIATDLGIERLSDMAHRLGLGEKYNFDLNEERAGLIPDQEWKIGRFGQKWKPGETIISSIGQGYILATPLQLAVMTSRLVNGGKAVKPWLVGYVGEQKMYQEQWPSLGLSEKHLKLVHLGMDRTVNHKDGTAYQSRIEERDKMMAGKTGTSQVKKISSYEREQGIKNEDVIWRHRDHALFVGYAPLKSPRYVVSVVVEHGGGGSTVAAPLARDLLLEVQKRDPAKVKINF